MSLLDALLLDPAPFNVWIAIRTDGIKGSGTASDPYHGGDGKLDAILDGLPANTRVHLGAGIFETNGYADGVSGGWQVKAGIKIEGSGIGVTTLQLVGAAVADQHYHAIGMNLSPNGTTPATPVAGFEISDLTIDCNLDSQPLRGQSTYTPVACGAVRVFGSRCRISRVKAINWGTKTLKEGCFVFSIIDASGETTDGSGQPVPQETTTSGIEDCIAVEPSQNCAREVTVLHLGGKKNAATQAQAFGAAPFIRNNFVDGGFKTSAATPEPYSSHFLTSIPGTIVTTEFDPDPPIAGLFVSKRLHHLVDGEWIRFYNPRDAVPQAQPEPWLALQPGLMMADRVELLKVFDDETLEGLFPDHFNDMYQIQSLYSWKPDSFKVDTQGVLFHTIGPRSRELVTKNNRLENPDTGQSPAFVHAPNRGDLSKIEQWLAAN